MKAYVIEALKILILGFAIMTAIDLVHADQPDQWTCTDTATMRTGDTWQACGVGEGMDEGDARKRALNHALDEFTALCRLSTGCHERDRSVEPKRTTCSVNRGWWKCYRMVEIVLH